jgi:predicted nucleic acid-binding protein
MKSVYVDTAALLAIGNERDAYHQQAAKIYQHLIEQGTALITANAVILETGNAFWPMQLLSKMFGFV